MANSTNQHAKQEIDRSRKDQGIGLFWPMVALLIGCVLVILYAVIMPSIKRAAQFAVLTELEQMDLALENYKKENGIYPPNAESAEFARHLQTRLEEQDIKNLAAIDSLDEDEILLFWLGGVASTSLNNSKDESAYYIVDENRTTDVDADGFLEYTGNNNCVFILRDGRAMYKNRTSGNAISASEMRSKQRPNGG